MELDLIFQALGRTSDNALDQSNGLNVGKGSGNGYQFSPDEVESILGEWQDLHGTIVSALANYNSGMPVVAPGNETASQTVADSAGTSGQAYTEHLSAMQTYAEKYITALSTALTNYRNAEEGGSASATSVQTQL